MSRFFYVLISAALLSLQATLQGNRFWMNEALN